jgi:hypothetical protein
MRGRRHIVTVLALLALAAAPAAAEVVGIEIASREPFAGDIDGKIGQYERIRGRVIYALDPEHPANLGIVDLDLTTANDENRVVFYADFEIIAPVDLTLAQPTVLYNVNNRGRRTWGSELFLLGRGYVTVSSGWIAEVPVRPPLLRLEAPIAFDEEYAPLIGTVRAEFDTDVAAESLPLSGQLSYEALDTELEDATLTRRSGASEPRVTIARALWTLQNRAPTEEGSGLIEATVTLDAGFEPGVIYELIYTARGSVVQGTGFAAIRDLVSFLKHDRSEKNPLRRPDGRPVGVRFIGEGRSQSGRALRMFLYDGFNADEEGRQVFDGVMPQIAGGGLGFFNHRFASPTRSSTQRTDHLYPVDVFPFTYGDTRDPFSGETDGILRRARASGTVPKVMHVDTSSEHWYRAASLVVTDPVGERDIVLSDDVRRYVYGGSQHSPATGPSDLGQLPPNPMNYRPLSEALFIALDGWITDGDEPPPSVYPRIAAGTLTGWRADETGWPGLPSVTYPTVMLQPEQVDYGKDYHHTRVITNHPPRVTGNEYRLRVPAVDADGNERDVVKLPALAVPVATYTSWNLRSHAIGAPDELLRLTGGYIPFARTATEREGSGDPRPSVAERYGDFDDYLARYIAAAEALVEQRFLLPEHLEVVKETALSHRPMFTH